VKLRQAVLTTNALETIVSHVRAATFVVELDPVGCAMDRLGVAVARLP